MTSNNEDEGITLEEYKKELLKADRMTQAAFDALDYCGLIQPEREEFETMAKEQEARGRYSRADVCRGLAHNQYWLVEAACSRMAQQLSDKRYGTDTAVSVKGGGEQE